MGIVKSVLKGAAVVTDQLLKDAARNATNFSQDERFNEEHRAEFAAKAAKYEAARASLQDSLKRL